MTNLDVLEGVTAFKRLMPNLDSKPDAPEVNQRTETFLPVQRDRHDAVGIPGSIPAEPGFPAMPLTNPEPGLPAFKAEEAKKKTLAEISPHLLNVRKLAEDPEKLRTALSDTLQRIGEDIAEDTDTIRKFVERLNEVVRTHRGEITQEKSTILIPLRQVESNPDNKYMQRELVASVDFDRLDRNTVRIPVELWEQFLEGLATPFRYDANEPTQNSLIYNLDNSAVVVNLGVLQEINNAFHNEGIVKQQTEIPLPAEKVTLEPITEEDDTPPKGVELIAPDVKVSEKIEKSAKRYVENIAKELSFTPEQQKALSGFLISFSNEYGGSAISEYSQTNFEFFFSDIVRNLEKIQIVNEQTDLSFDGFATIIGHIDRARTITEKTPSSEKFKFLKKEAQKLEAFLGVMDAVSELFHREVVAIREPLEGFPAYVSMKRVKEDSPSKDLLDNLILLFQPVEKTEEDPEEEVEDSVEVADTSQTEAVDVLSDVQEEASEKQPDTPLKKKGWMTGAFGLKEVVKPLEVTVKFGKKVGEWQERRQSERHAKDEVLVNNFYDALEQLDWIPDTRERNRKYYLEIARDVQRLITTLTSLLEAKKPLTEDDGLDLDAWRVLKQMLEAIQEVLLKDSRFHKANDVIPNFIEDTKPDGKNGVRAIGNAVRLREMLQDFQAYLLKPIGETDTADEIHLFRSWVKGAFLPEIYTDKRYMLLQKLPKITYISVREDEQNS